MEWSTQRPPTRCTIQQAAARYGVRIGYLRAAIDARQLRALRAGRSVWVAPADVARLLAEQREVLPVRSRLGA
jgi:excisionase family DNA binding protein